MSNSSQTLIEVERVSKIFCRDLRRSLWYGVKDAASDMLPWLANDSNERKLRQDEFWANREISFQVRRGECLGIIGRNGAGKTTLLKTLNGLVKPDAGEITMRGRIGSLIALGAGFDPVLTGRENIYVNGAVLGLGRRQIAAKLDEIVEFADLGDFIDTPLQNYSSGMKVRLGFSVAAILIEPDVLILDEVLAVGDMRFKARCNVTIGRLLQNSSVILVSHQLEQINRLCQRTLWLERGQIRQLDETDKVLPAYTNSQTQVQEHDTEWETSARVSDFDVQLRREPQTRGEPAVFRFRITVEERLPFTAATIAILSENYSLVCQCHAEIQAVLEPYQTYEFDFCVEELLLRRGLYYANVTLYQEGFSRSFLKWSLALHFRIELPSLGSAPYQPVCELQSVGL